MTSWHQSIIGSLRDLIRQIAGGEGIVGRISVTGSTFALQDKCHQHRILGIQA